MASDCFRFPPIPSGSFSARPLFCSQAPEPGSPPRVAQLHDILEPAFAELQSIFIHYCGSSIQGSESLSSATKLGMMELLTLAKDTALCTRAFPEDELTRHFAAANAQQALAESGSADRHARVAGVKKKKVRVCRGGC